MGRMQSTRAIKPVGFSPLEEFCVQVQQEFVFYSSSILIIYEGDAQKQSETNVAIRLVDFAHTFPVSGKIDSNFYDGLASFMAVLEDTIAADTHEDSSI